MTKEGLNELSNKVIGLAIKAHKALGPGFIERIYEKALAYEFTNENIRFANQAIIKVNYQNVHLGNQRIDFMVEEEIILELKSVSEINNIHMAQLLSYLKTSNKKLGLILNFAKVTLDIKRVVNKF
jgi:GxxExxY protein